MSYSKKEFDEILQEETIKLLEEEGVSEGFLDRIKDLYKSFTKPKPNASQGVGRAFAGYRVPDKQKAKPTTGKEPERRQTALAVKQPTNIEKVKSFQTEPDAVDVPFEKSVKDITPKQISTVKQKQLPQHKEPPRPIEPAKQLDAPQQTKPKQLSAPQAIVTSPELGETVNPNDVEMVTRIVNKYLAEPRLKKVPQNDTKYILGYLIKNNRILANPTKIPKTPEIQDADVVQEITLPSYQQAQVSPETLEKFAIDLHKKIRLDTDNNVVIPVIHISAILKTIYEDGRLAISVQKLRRMVIPDKSKQNESKSYNNFYNSWKEYTNSGEAI